MKKFIVNLIISFLGYLLISFIGYLIGTLCVHLLFYTETTKGLLNYATPSWVIGTTSIACIIINIVVPIVSYFILGKKLHTFNHVLNYLSVCGSFIFSIFLLFYNLKYFNNNFPTQLTFGLNGSFGYIWMLTLYMLKKSNIIGYCLMAIIPSIITWLGMEYKHK